MNNFEWVSPVVQLTTAGGFTTLVWYLMVKYIPSIEERHRTERTELFNYIKERDKKVEDVTASFQKELSDLTRALREDLRAKSQSSRIES